MSKKFINRNILKLIIPLFVMTTFVSVNKKAAVSTSAWSGSQTSNEGNYYSSVTGSDSGTALKSKLQGIISSGTNESYSWERYEAADEAMGDSSKVLLIYSRQSVAKTSRNSGGSTGWNREHSFAKNFFSEAAPAVNDNHHIFADDAKTNSDRGNKRFNELSPSSSTRSFDGYGNSTDNFYDGSYFMPNDLAKGEVARATMYMNTRYGYDITLNFYSIALMLKWHIENPVTDREIYRNNTVHTLQKNRNPYIDHPEYACSVWGDTNSSTQSLCGASSTINVTNVTVSPTTLTLTVQDTLQMNATVLPSNATNKALTWTSSNTSVATVSANGLVTAKVAGTTTITATSVSDTSKKGTATITVINAPTFGTLSSIGIKTPANKLSYTVGNTFSSAGLVLTARDNSNPVITKDVTSGYTTNFDGVTFNASHIGNKTVIVSYKEGSITKTVNYSITVSEATATEKIYTKITSAGQLQIGTNYVIAGAYGNIIYGMTTTQSTNNRTAKTVTLSDGKIEDEETIQKIELTAGTTSNTFGLRIVNGSTQGYLYAASAGSNHLKTQSVLDDNASWLITFSGGIFSAVAQGSNTRNNLQFNYNGGTALFSCYAGASQSAVMFYIEEDVASKDPSVTITSSVSQVVARNTLQLAASTENANGAAINWSINDSTVATINSTVLLTALKAGSVIVTASIVVGGNTYTDTIEITVTANPYDHEGTAADPFSVKDALLKAEETGSIQTSEEFYVKGIISEVTEIDTGQYGNATFKIKDSLGDSVSFIAYRVKWGASGANFTTETAKNIVVGYEVTLVGKIIKYNGTTPELNQNSKVLSVDKTPAIYAETKEFADWMMDSLRDSEECEEKFIEAWYMWNDLSSDAKEMFVEHVDFDDAEARLSNWAIANGETFASLNNGAPSPKDKSNTTTKDNSSLAATLIIGVIGLTTLLGYYFLQKKRKTQN